MNREGDFVQLPYSTRNPIEFTIPKLLYYDGGLLDVPQENSLTRTDEDRVARLMNIWSTDRMHRSLYEERTCNFLILRARVLNEVVFRAVWIFVLEVPEYHAE